MESEHSYSGDSSSSSSDSSSSSSDGDEEIMEPLRILGNSLELPQELCEDYGIFKEFFSMKLWDSLEDKHKDELKKYLPKFPENDEEEKEKTVKMLFNYENFHFSTPLGDFYNNLRQGNFRPDIAKMRRFLKKARTKQQKHKVKSYYAKLLPEVLISRERLLAAAKLAPPGPAPSLPPLPPKPSARTNCQPLYLRSRQRYFEELTAIRSEVGGDDSEDENYPEGPPSSNLKKRKHTNTAQAADGNISGTLSGMDPGHLSSWDCLKNILAAHRTRRQYRENHPELNTAGITLDDIKQRVALVNGAKKLMFGAQKNDPSQRLKRGPKPGLKQTKRELAAKKLREENQESVENRPLLPNIKIKCERESDSEGSSFVDPVTSPKLIRKSIDQEIKQENDARHSSMSNTSYGDLKLDKIKQEPVDPSSKGLQPVPIKLEDLDGIDMMSLPVEIADDSGDVMADTSTETNEESLFGDEALTETTHANFFSLVRALFPARAAHRASKQQLQARCAAVMKSPIAPLNTWYNLSEDWCSELESVLDFLAGERGTHPDDFVPYLQFIPETQMYQWIGAGRDCDAILGRLCERWLHTSAWQPRQKPSEAKYQSSVSVKPPTNAELVEFRAQERRRYAAAAKPFTYIQHGYRAIVGPCARSVWACASWSSLVKATRPRHATFIALVRDAVARLPNGEGTRRDVLELLKMSQYIVPGNDEMLQNAVNLALEKLFTAKRDPIVKYDQRTAVWKYLYRNRTEEEWLKSISKRGAKGGANTSSTSLSTSPSSQNTSLVKDMGPMDLELGGMEEVIDNASDSDVDVDDVPSSTTLSSAQLLMQVNQTQPKPAAPAQPKPKGKYNIQSPKTKQTPKQSTQKNLMAQSVKQASLISQATKQATLQAQTVKQNSLAQAKPQVVTKPNITPPKPNQPQVPKSVVTTVNVTKQTYTVPKTGAVQTKVNIAKQLQSPKQNVIEVKQPFIQNIVKTSMSQVMAPVKPSATIVVNKNVAQVVSTPSKSPLIKQRPLQQKAEAAAAMLMSSTQQIATAPTRIQQQIVAPPTQSKVPTGTRSLLIRPPNVPTTATAVVSTPNPQIPAARRGVVRVLSPATPSSGKSLISPRALMPQGTHLLKKRPSITGTQAVTTIAQSTSNVTTVVSSVNSAVTSTLPTRTVQLADGRTVQLANQTVHLPSGQAVQLSSGHTLQLSSLQLPTHSVRLPSGQTVQLAQTVQTMRANAAKNQAPRLPSSPKPNQQIPVSTVQLSGQTVQIGGQTVQLAGQSVQLAGQSVQLAGQSVQLTGHTVKLPSGQSVQVASQSVQLPSGQTVQLSTGQTVQIGQNVQLANQNQLNTQTVQLGSQTVQLPGGQTVQLAGGQTVQLPSGQTIQLSSGQTVQLSSGQTIQLAGQTVQLANQTPKTLTQVVRQQNPGDKNAQPIVAKLLTNAQGQMLSLEGMVGAGRPLQLGARPRLPGHVRVLSPGARRPRPLLLAAGKPLHNIILQQSDGTAIRVTSSGGATPTQTIVLGNIGQTSSSSTTSAPVLKLQQVNPIHQVKLPQTIKIQQAGTTSTVATSSGVRSVLMDGQQLKLVSGRHVLARLLRPANPPQ